MTLKSDTARGLMITFRSSLPGFIRGTLAVAGFEGREALSHPYRYKLDLYSENDDLDITALLQHSVTLTMKRAVWGEGEVKGFTEHHVHGILASLDAGERHHRWEVYRAMLVPRLWRLSLDSQSRIFMNQTVPHIVQQILEEDGIPSKDMDFGRLQGNYPVREYVAQYQESDLQFVSRLLEHEGIFYFFQQTEEAEKIIFGDHAEAYDRPGDLTLPFYQERHAEDPGETEGWLRPEGIHALTVRHNMIQTQVVLEDYNYRTPSVDLKVSTPVVAEGFGQYYEYGDHYKDQGEGKVYAQVRAEEIKCRQKLFRGEGDSRSFRAGYTYTLADHYRPGFNLTYLLTEVRHSASQTIELAGMASRVSATYANEFESIPADVSFRPARVTPKPRIHGTMHARVDAAGDGKYAEIDDQGRYKVQLPFDLSGKDKATASRWIRKAEPYTGPDYGIHFPLHKGAEVILTHIDGDPDRPIIVNAVPNPETGSPVKGGNQSQCVIRTGGGNQMVIEDSEGGEQIKLSSPHGGTKLWLGAPNGPAGGGLESANNWSVKVGVDELIDIGANVAKKVGGSVDENISGSAKEAIAGDKNSSIGGSETKRTHGVKTEVIAGAKNSIILGGKYESVVPAIVTFAAGVRVTYEAGLKYSYGPTQKEMHGAAIKRNGALKREVGAMDEKLGALLSEVGSLNEKIGSLTANVGNLSNTFGSLTEKVGSLSQDVGKWDLSGGPVNWSVGTITLKGADVVLEGAGIDLKGSSIRLEASTVDVTGSTECGKDLSVNGKLSAHGGADLG